jgi:D-serine deaminase-like pyridoxal phosphate-dependent protein
MYNPQPGDRLDRLDTPSMIVDLDLMEANIARLMNQLLPTGVNIRPHLKTTKSPILARKLIEAGAKGCCVAKLSEAEVIAGGGIEDLLITCEIIGAPKVARLVELFRHHPQVKTVIDSPQGATAIDAALAQAGSETPLQVLIDLNVGQNRTGVTTGEPALALARHIASLPHLKLIGVQGYEGHLQHLHDRQEREEKCRAAMTLLTATADLLRQNGFNIETVTTGGTGTSEFCATFPGVTEVQPGSFIFMDTDYRNAVGRFFSNSLTILATVISKPGPGRAVIDAGLKSLSTDSGFAEPKDLPGAGYVPNGDEHGTLSWEDGPELVIGDRVEMIPSHIDPTINLHDFYYAHRQGVIEEIWPVAARGKVQ